MKKAANAHSSMQILIEEDNSSINKFHLSMTTHFRFSVTLIGQLETVDLRWKQMTAEHHSKRSAFIKRK